MERAYALDNSLQNSPELTQKPRWAFAAAAHTKIEDRLKGLLADIARQTTERPLIKR
jgi:hypothetical protein